MTKAALQDFVNESIARNQDADGLSQEELYGLYLSWCGLRGATPVPARSFRAGLRAVNINPTRGGLYTGLAMTGPAACDYIVHRQLPLAVLNQEARGSAAAPSRARAAEGASLAAPAA